MLRSMAKAGGQRPITERMLGSVPAIAACVAAVFYLAGMGAFAVRLSRAGLSFEDYAPLFSLEQLLRIGFTWIAPALPWIILVVAAFLAIVLAEHDLGRRAKEFEDEYSAGLKPEERRIWQRAFSRARIQTEWSKVLEGVDSAASALDAAGNTDAVEKAHKLKKTLRTFKTVWVALFGIALFAPLFTMWVPIAVAFYVLVTATLLLTGAGPAERSLSLVVVVAVLGIALNAIVNPAPLPRVWAITRSGPEEHVGSLVGISDGDWYIGQGHGRVLVLHESDIVCSRLVSQRAHRSVLRLTWLTTPQPRTKLVRPNCVAPRQPN